MLNDKKLNKILWLLKRTEFSKYKCKEYIEDNDCVDRFFPVFLQLLLSKNTKVKQLRKIIFHNRNKDSFRDLSRFLNDLKVVSKPLRNTQITSDEHMANLVQSFGNTCNEIFETFKGDFEINKNHIARDLLTDILNAFFDWFIGEKENYFLTYLFIPQAFIMADFLKLESPTQQSQFKYCYKIIVALLFRVFVPVPQCGETFLDEKRLGVISYIKEEIDKLSPEHTIKQLLNEIRIRDERVFIQCYSESEYRNYVEYEEMVPIGNVIFSEKSLIEGPLAIIKALRSFEFIGNGIVSACLKKIKLKGVVGEDLLKESISQEGWLFRLPLSNKFTNVESIKDYLDLIFYEKKGGRYVTFILKHSDEYYINRGVYVCYSLNYTRMCEELARSGYRVYRYVDKDIFNGSTNKQIKEHGYLKSESNAILHWPYDKYEYLEVEENIAREMNNGLASMGLSTSLSGVKSKLGVTSYDEVYKEYFSLEPWSELRYTSSSDVKCQQDVIDYIFDKLNALRFVANETEVFHDYPKRITGYPYLIRSFTLPSTEVACDVELEADEISEQLKIEVRKEQQGLLQQAELTSKMTQNEEVEATITVYVPDSGNAQYAYCDKKYWDNDTLWGSLDGVCFHPAIRFGRSSLIISVLIESGHQVEKDNSLAKNLKQLFEELRLEFNIELEFKRPPGYYLALEDYEGQYNWIEDPVLAG